MYAVLVPIPVYIEKWACMISFFVLFFIITSHCKVTHLSENHNQAGVFHDLQDEDMIQMVNEKCILG